MKTTGAKGTEGDKANIFLVNSSVKSRQKLVPQIRASFHMTRVREMRVDTRCLPGALGLPYWHYQLVLSLYLHQPESHQLSFNKWLNRHFPWLPRHIGRQVLVFCLYPLYPFCREPLSFPFPPAHPAWSNHWSHFHLAPCSLQNLPQTPLSLALANVHLLHI